VNATLDLADLVTYLLCVSIMIDPINRAINFTRLYQEGYTGFTRFMEVLEVEPDIQDSPDAIELTNVRGNIEFRDVSFKYREEHDYALKDISLNIKVGEYVGRQGYSCGHAAVTAAAHWRGAAGCVLVRGNGCRQYPLRQAGCQHEGDH
jgi:ATP-binding cassette subfamily B protein